MARGVRHIDSSPGWINRELAEIKREMREDRAAKRLAASTIGEGGITVKDGGSIDVEGGDINVAPPGGISSSNFAAGSTGWQIAGNGNAEFNDLTLRGGIIGNDALANPVSPAVAAGFTDGLNFAAMDAVRVLHTETINVPAGFTRALVNATATAGATADGSGVAYVADCEIDGVGSADIAMQLGANQFGSVTVPFARSLTGLSGSFTIRVRAARGVGDAQNGTVNGHLAATVLFLR